MAGEPPASAGFEALGPSARLVVGPETGQVVSPTARLIYSARIKALVDADDLEAMLGPAARRAELAPPAVLAVAPGTTASVDACLPEDVQLSKLLPRRAVHVELYRRPDSGDGYDLAISSEDLVEAGTPTAGSPSTARELMLLSRSLQSDAERFALAIPFPFGGSPARSIVVEVRLSKTEVDPSAVEALSVHVQQSASVVAAKRSRAPASPQAMAIERTLDGLGTGRASPRGAMTFVAEQTQAGLTQAVVAVADDRLLELLAGQIRGRWEQLGARDRRSIAWLLDRATIDTIASVNEADAPQMLPPVIGALSIYAGEAGRQLDVLRSLANSASSSEDLYNRIVAEHLILLEESSPGLRVRAYDWLRSANRAPAGYDPLGTLQSRRAAIKRANDESTTHPTTVPTTQPAWGAQR